MEAIERPRFHGRAARDSGANLPIRYAIQADNLSFWGISLNLKYFFDM